MGEGVFHTLAASEAAGAPLSISNPTLNRMARTDKAQRRRARKGDAAEDKSWWAQRPLWLQHLICLALLLIVSVGFFAPAHFSGKSLAGSDSVSWRGMAEAMITYEGRTGEEALWAPNAFGGMPGYMIYYAAQVPQLDAVPTLLREFAWPTSHFIFLLAGTYLLVFFLTRSPLSGVLSACAYGLTTYIPIILVVGHNTKFIALAFAPWLALAFAYALWRPRLLAALLFAMALAVNLRAGHVQITYYLTFLLGVWWLVEAVGAVRKRNVEDRLARFGKATGWLALGSVLGLMMVAQPYLSNAEYKAHTIRGERTTEEGDGLDTDYAMRWSQGPGELVTLAVADAYGGGSRQGASYWGPKPFTEGPHYLGGLVLLLAALGLWKWRTNAALALGLGAFLMALFALGRHFALLNEPMFAYFPLFDAFRAPETWLVMVSFALAVLAGLGLAYATGRTPKRYTPGRAEEVKESEEKRTRAVYLATGVALGLAALLWLGGSAFFGFEREGERRQIEEQIVRQIREQRPDLSAQNPQVQQFVRQQTTQALASVKEARAEAFGSDALRTLLFLALGGVALILHRRRVLPAWAAQALLALLVVIDLGGVGRRYFSEDDLAPQEDLTAQIPEYGFDQFIAAREEEAGGPGRFRVLSLERDPMTNARPSYFYESLGGYHGAKLRRFQDYVDHVFQNPDGSINDNALDLLSTRYVVARGPLPGTRVVHRDERTGLVVLENPDALPRAFLVGQTEVIEEPEATWERLRSASFDPRETALLSEPIPGFDVAPLDSSSTASVELQRFSPREIVWEIETDAPRLLVASEIYYPEGWHATLDGEAVPIYRTDYLLRAVPIPAGEHRLVMRFDPQSHTLGLWIAGLSTALVYGGTALLLGLAFVRRRRGGERRGDDDPKER